LTVRNDPDFLQFAIASCLAGSIHLEILKWSVKGKFQKKKDFLAGDRSWNSRELAA
jgi:hypothetical protein